MFMRIEEETKDKQLEKEVKTIPDFIKLLILHWRTTTQVIVSIIAILWIYDEITSTAGRFGHDPRLAVIVGVLVCWGIIMYLLRGLNKNERKK